MIPTIARVLLWSRRHRAAALALTVALATLSTVGARRLTFDTDVLSLLPRDGRVIPAFREFVEHFGSLDELYVVFTAPDGYAITDYESQIARWVEYLGTLPEIVNRSI